MTNPTSLQKDNAFTGLCYFVGDEITQISDEIASFSDEIASFSDETTIFPTKQHKKMLKRVAVNCVFMLKIS